LIFLGCFQFESAKAKATQYSHFSYRSQTQPSLIDQIWFNIAGQFWVLHQHSWNSSL